MDKEPDNDCSVSLPLNPASIVVSSPGVKHQVDVQLTDVCFSVPTRKGKCKTILHNVSGEFRSGRLTAILGPSGAGKTTLLNLLGNRCSGKNQAVFRTRLRLNGATSHEQPELFQRISVCYVPQEFALMPLLTTRETINLAARFKLKRKKNDEASRKFIVEDVAEKLGLQDCMDTLACNLSGGERKRLSIAVEMITSPSVMLLDEPTSGLDSASSNQVMEMLSETARRGCTVVCSVHQPSSRMICRFDDLLVLCRGRCRYCGPQDLVLRHFKEAGYACPPFYNLAEFVLEVVTGQRGGDYERISNSPNDEFRSMPAEKTGYLEPPVRRYAVPRQTQVQVLMYRAFVCVSRDPILTYLRLSAHVVVALFLGLLFYDFGSDASKLQSNIACLFFLPLFLFFGSAMPAVQTFPTEASVFVREKTNNWYSLGSYYITKVLSDLPLQILCPTSYLIISYYLTGQPLEPTRFSQVWLVCTLFTILAQSFGILTGIAFNTDAGVFMIPASNIPMILFAGFFLKLGEIPVYLRFISDISFFRFAFEGILQAVYLGRSKLPCHAEFCYLRKSEHILGELDMPSMSFSHIIYGLFGWIVVLHTLIYVLLSFKLRLAKR